MDELHSVLLLVDTALSAEPVALRHEADALGALRSQLGVVKQGVSKHRGLLDYHGLECESLASYLANKIEHLFLADDL